VRSLVILARLGLAVSAGFGPAVAAGEISVERGLEVSILAGCQDCHTEGYRASQGKIDLTKAMKGSSIGWQGPWGTTYPPNLRLTAANLSEVGRRGFGLPPERPHLHRDGADCDRLAEGAPWSGCTARSQGRRQTAEKPRSHRASSKKAIQSMFRRSIRHQGAGTAFPYVHSQLSLSTYLIRGRHIGWGC
jgi:hypothetical protein